MFKIRQPLFNADGHPATEVYQGGWNGFFDKSDDAASDEQPETDSDADYVEDEDTQDAPDSPESDDNDGDEETSDELDEAADEPEEDPEITLGEGKKPVKLSELKQGYLRQADYTKKTQELATQRTELDGQRESLKVAQGFKDHMEANPWLWGQVNSALQEFEKTGVLPIEEVLQDAQYGKYVNHLLAENNQLKTQLDSINGEYEGVKMSSAMQSLKSDLQADYGDLVTDEYIGKLQERAKAESLSPATLKEIAEGYLAKQSLSTNKKDVKAMSKKAEAKAIQKLAETKRSAPSSTKSTGVRPSTKSGNAAQAGSWGDFFKSITD